MNTKSQIYVSKISCQWQGSILQSLATHSLRVKNLSHWDIGLYCTSVARFNVPLVINKSPVPDDTGSSCKEPGFTVKLVILICLFSRIDLRLLVVYMSGPFSPLSSTNLSPHRASIFCDVLRRASTLAKRRRVSTVIICDANRRASIMSMSSSIYGISHKNIFCL
jgi:hypothetical protein